MKRATMLIVLGILTTAGAAGLIAADEPIEAACNCNDGATPATTTVSDAQAAEASGRSADGPEANDASEATSTADAENAQEPAESAPLRVAAQPAYDGEPIRVAGYRFASRAVFVGQGRRCGTPTPTADELAIERNAVAAARRVPGAERVMSRQTPGKVKVVFHVIHKGDEGRVAQGQIEQQVEVLNTAFMTAGFTFELDDITFTDVESDPAKAGWFTMRHTTPPHSSELQAKEALRRDTDTTLNVYTANLNDGLLGWATFPSDLAEDPDVLGYDPAIRDGVVILHTSVPQADGQPNPDGGPFGMGHTLTHEVGHYLGLYHTFQGGCLPPGDEVMDTPAHQVTFGCPAVAPDTCLGDTQKDPIHNFMNYSDDACMSQFSPLQVARMHEQCGVFRPKFFDVTGSLHDEIRAAARSAAR